jgi:hypothetical protein
MLRQYQAMGNAAVAEGAERLVALLSHCQTPLP